MELTQLKYFQTVAKLGSVSKAAKELYVTQPNLSRSIMRLEEEVGMPLFDHRRGRIVLNDYGRMFLSSVDIALTELSSGLHAVRRMHEAGQNNLSLGGSVAEVLADILIGFSMKYPEIGIRQFDCSRQEMREKLLNGVFDIGVDTNQMSDRALVFELLDEKEYVMLVGAGHRLAERESISLRELSNERFICSDVRLGATFLKNICRAAGFEPDIAFEVESNELIYNLLDKNQGIACMPISHISKIYRDYPQSDIHVIHIQENIPKAQLGIIYRKDYQFSHAAKLFVEFMREWLKKEDLQVHMLTEVSREGKTIK